ncbi:4-hydroxy-3-polyprenylbenzoate decarboxylase [Sinobacterium caligoides]|uniref:Flavin prenyltransferase UbiX n=1 Tax=Sinobacterium caligoides TaxID=933926 RepID=A0A3N2DNJ7_9GAMM|nr:flavin prenyltransferase UbiX [Sinobacterium caligoides]ROS01381.1 4-hydroxy-3-polyprenylbenzoate decarboxylase [Sinobacterium caligoides]
MKQIALAITGASGAQYGVRLLQCLLEGGHQVQLMVSEAAFEVIEIETELRWPRELTELQSQLDQQYQLAPGQLRIFSRQQWLAPVASGSSPLDAMVICPCSGGTLSAISCGASNNLIERAADVVLKERRQLIIVPREAPYSQIHLENMLKLTKMGAVVIPASPGFYQQPSSVQEMIDFIVARILDQLGIAQTLLPAWDGVE